MEERCTSIPPASTAWTGATCQTVNFGYEQGPDEMLPTQPYGLTTSQMCKGSAPQRHSSAPVRRRTYEGDLKEEQPKPWHDQGNIHADRDYLLPPEIQSHEPCRLDLTDLTRELNRDECQGYVNWIRCHLTPRSHDQ